MGLAGKIAFSSGWSCNFNIWSLDLANGELAQLTSHSDLHDMPSYSPDGRKIALISVGEDSIPSLSIMNANGTDLRRLTTDMYCNHPAWSPDGTKILFTSNQKSGDEIDLCLYELSTDQVHTIFRKSGIEREPSFSPDGQSIIYAAPPKEISGKMQDIHTTDIWLYDLESGNDKLLCTHPARDYGPVFSPDGSQIAFVSHRKGRSSEEYVKALGEIRSSMDSSDIASIDRAIESIQALEQDSDIYVMKADGTEVRQLTSNPGADVGACWSPDGKYLVYTSSTPGAAATERLKIIEVATGEDMNLHYDRQPLRKDIEAGRASTLNRSLFQQLIPDFIERKFVDRSYWGEERRPTWCK